MTREQRYARDHPCPICGGWDQQPRCDGLRCWGFVLGARNAAVCMQRPSKRTVGEGYLHFLDHDCPCEAPHATANDHEFDRTRARTDGGLLVEEGRWPIRDYTTGAIVAVQHRYRNGERGKTYKWKRNGQYGLGGLPEGALPLYGGWDWLQRKDREQVIFTEGAKAADALLGLDLPAVGIPLGAPKVPDIQVFEPFRNARMLYWPDADKAGEDQLDNLGQMLAAGGLPLGVVRWSGAPRKGDAADFVAGGGTREEVQVMIEAAEPWRPLTRGQVLHPEDALGTSSGTVRPAPPIAPPERHSQATRMVALAKDVELSVTPDGDSYATFAVGKHRETWSLASVHVRHWLADMFYAAVGAVPGSQAIQDAVNTLSGRARREGVRREIGVRLIEGQDGALYLDLGDQDWRVVRIDETGWALDPDPCVRFRRPSSMLPLPFPARFGSLELLRPFINPATDDDWRLRVGWLVGVLNPRGPYPILLLSGEQGTAKSFAQRTLRKVVDPNKALLVRAPRDEEDLIIAATNGLIVGFDNVSGLSDWLSDALCRLSTGSGLSKRTLYTSVDETVLAISRSVMFNTIDDLALRGDLLDRTIVQVQPLLNGRRRDEKRLLAEFAAVHAQILGALLDVVSACLANIDTTDINDPPRMVDFATWVSAGEAALGWTPGTFLAAYRRNIKRAAQVVAESCVLATPLRRLLNAQADATWSGTATDLLIALNALLNDEERYRLRQPRTGWPGDATRLSSALRRWAPLLRAVEHVGIDFGRDGTGGRRIKLRFTSETIGNAASVASSTSQPGRHNFNVGTPDSDAEPDASVPGETVTVTSESPRMSSGTEIADAAVARVADIPASSKGPEHEDADGWPGWVEV